MAPDSDRRNRAYLIFRLFIVAAGFALGTLHQMSPGAGSAEGVFRFLYGILGFYLLAALTLFATYPKWRAWRVIQKGQIFLDLGTQAVLIWGTGGVLSVFSPLLVVTLVSATSLLSGRGAFALATCASVLLAAATLAGALGIEPPGAPGIISGTIAAREPTLVWSYLAGSIVALYATSSLAARFSLGLRSVQGMQSEILENMAEGLIAVDSRGLIVQANREARKLLAFPAALSRRGEVPLEALFPGAEYAELRRAFQSGQRRAFVAVLEGPDGHRRPVEVKISSVNGDDQGPRYRIGILTDLTLKREIEAAERRIQKLEELQVMAFGIAHEIRNPLASIRGCVQEIARLRGEEPGVAAYAEIVLRESDRLDKLLEDFLRYARRGPPDLAPVGLNEVVEEAVFLLKRRSDFGKREISLRSSGERFRIFGHRDSLLQLFLNLGLNAIEATSADKGRIAFSIERRPAPPSAERGQGREGVEVAVSDNGRGIPAEQRAHIFTPFFSTKPSGSGLGLCLVERIVKEHLGTLEFSSEDGAGTTFRVWFPAMRESGAKEDLSESEVPEDQEVAELQPV